VHGRGYGSTGFGPAFTPPIVQKLLIANIAVFLAQVMTGHAFDGFVALAPMDLWARGALWQPVTYMWMHGGLGHILANMFSLWMFGSPVALVWGPQRFLRYYLLCGVGAGFIIVSYPWIPVLLGAAGEASLHYPTLGASGAIFGVLLAYSLTWPDRTIMLIFPPVAFRAIWLIPLLFFMEIYFGPSNVSHLGHLGGVLVGWLLLRSQGDTRGLLSLDQVKWRFKRWRMRKRLRSVQMEQQRRNSDDSPFLH